LGVGTVTRETIIARETIAAARASGLDRLLRMHWEEVAQDKHAIKLNVDWLRYAEVEKNGGFASFTARNGGILVGYSGFFINSSPHYSDHVMAANDVIYLLPEHRGVAGLRLIIEAENALADMGVSKILYHTKTDALLGTDGRDSLSAVEDLLDLEERYRIRLPDNLLVGKRTLADCLVALGYSHTENIIAKLLIGGS